MKTNKKPTIFNQYTRNDVSVRFIFNRVMRCHCGAGTPKRRPPCLPAGRKPPAWKFYVFIFFTLSFILFPSICHAWWDTDWGLRQKLTFDNAAQAQDLTNFPVLVVLNSARIDYSRTQDNGEDIRFVDADDATELSYEIEDWDEVGTSYLWVNVPQIDASSNTDFIYMYFDNSGATVGEDPNGTWDTNFEAVWHLTESGAGVAGEYKDSTSNDKHATGAGLPVQIAGKIGNAQDFEGADYITIATPGFGLTNYVTVELWIYGDAAIQPQADNCFGGNDAGAVRVLGSHIPWSTGTVYWDAGNSGASYNRINKAAVAAEYEGAWNYWVFTKNASTGFMYIFLNGTSWHSGNSLTYAFEAMTAFYIGSNGAAGANYDGIIDEFRISNTDRTASWLAAQYLSMTDNFVSFGIKQNNPQTYSSAEGGVEIKGGITITS